MTTFHEELLSALVPQFIGILYRHAVELDETVLYIYKVHPACFMGLSSLVANTFCWLHIIDLKMIHFGLRNVNWFHIYVLFYFLKTSINHIFNINNFTICIIYIYRLYQNLFLEIWPKFFFKNLQIEDVCIHLLTSSPSPSANVHFRKIPFPTKVQTSFMNAPKLT